MVKAVVLQGLRSENRFLAWAPSSLNNHKVSWLKSERKGSGKIEKSRWCSGGVVVVLWWCCGGVVVVVLWCSNPEGRGSIPGWAASSFTLVSEWKKPIR